MKVTTKMARWFCATAALGWMSAAQASVDFFLKIDGVKGEVADTRHRGEIEVLRWSFGATSPTVVDANGGTSSGKVSYCDLSIMKRADTASPLLMLGCATGKHFPRVTLTLRSRGENQVEFVHLVLEDVNVAGILIGLLQGEEVAAAPFSLSYGKIGIEYFTIVGGKPGERSEFAWNIPENRVGTVTYPLDPTDADGDGLPDAWETLYKVTDPLADPDGDGATNWEEFVAGTSPNDRNQVFKSTLNFAPGSPNATLSWLSVPAKTYTVRVTGELGSEFRTLTTVDASSEGTTTFALPPSSLNQFFRVEVAP